MNLQKILTAFFIAAVIAAGFTVWLSRQFAKPASQPLHYVVTTKKMETGETFTADSVKLADWPASSKLDGAFSRVDDVVGHTVQYPLASGQPVLAGQLSLSGTNIGLSGHIPEGMRALSLKSDQVVGVAGYLLPGTHVDVLVTLRGTNGVDTTTTTVLQDAQIITAGQKMQADPEGKPTPVDVVTVLVTPEQAERVVLASSQGSLHFVLRNGTDHAMVAENSVHLSDIDANREPMKVPSPKRKENALPRKPVYSVEVLRGDKQTVENF